MLPVALGPRFHSASSINEYRKHERKSGEWGVELAGTKRWRPNRCEPIVQTLRDPRYATILWDSSTYYGDSFTLLHVNDVHTSQATQVRTPTACYADSFTFLYVNVVRTSQEARIRAYSLSNGDSFLLFTSHKEVLAKIMYETESNSTFNMTSLIL
jgi:hypothetical protein